MLGAAVLVRWDVGCWVLLYWCDGVLGVVVLVCWLLLGAVGSVCVCQLRVAIAAPAEEGAGLSQQLTSLREALVALSEHSTVPTEAQTGCSRCERSWLSGCLRRPA